MFSLINDNLTSQEKDLTEIEKIIENLNYNDCLEKEEKIEKN